MRLMFTGTCCNQIQFYALRASSTNKLNIVDVRIVSILKPFYDAGIAMSNQQEPEN